MCSIFTDFLSRLAGQELHPPPLPPSFFSSNDLTNNSRLPMPTTTPPSIPQQNCATVQHSPRQPSTKITVPRVEHFRGVTLQPSPVHPSSRRPPVCCCLSSLSTYHCPLKAHRSRSAVQYSTRCGTAVRYRTVQHVRDKRRPCVRPLQPHPKLRLQQQQQRHQQRKKKRGSSLVKEHRRPVNARNRGPSSSFSRRAAAPPNKHTIRRSESSSFFFSRGLSSTRSGGGGNGDGVDQMTG